MGVSGTRQLGYICPQGRGLTAVVGLGYSIKLLLARGVPQHEPHLLVIHATEKITAGYFQEQSRFVTQNITVVCEFPAKQRLERFAPKVH